MKHEEKFSRSSHIFTKCQLLAWGLWDTRIKGVITGRGPTQKNSKSRVWEHAKFKSETDIKVKEKNKIWSQEWRSLTYRLKFGDNVQFLDSLVYLTSFPKKDTTKTSLAVTFRLFHNVFDAYESNTIPGSPHAQIHVAS
jgi:hypothetical protein